ncbi:MAG: YaeQ family protein [Duodenibacillus sp.]|nr:YaeQ family protein [Duodenibacillus sp.]
MALGATIYKASLDISDIDRGYYATHALTIARHPSETERRMMVRLLAFCLYAGEHVEFGRGLSAEGEPAIHETNEAGDIGRWIEVGNPDNKSLRRAAGKSDDVVVLAYDEAKTEAWWASNKGDFGKIGKLTVRALSDEDAEKLESLAARNMHLTATIQDGMVWIADQNRNLELAVRTLLNRGEQVF